MNINIKATNMELTPAIRGYVEEKVSALEKFIKGDKDSAQAQVEVGKSSKHHQKGEVFRAEVNIRFAGTKLRAVKEAYDLYGAIDLVKDELSDELASMMGRKETLFRRGARQIKNIIRGITRR